MTAAYHLAKLGLQTLLIEKLPLPRYKPCGGGVSPIIAKYFDFDLTPAIALQVHTIRYTWKRGDGVEVNLPTAMWMVHRGQFDQFLIDHCLRQGVEVKDNAAVTGINFDSHHWQIQTTDGTFLGQYLIGADGVTGSMTQWLGLKQQRPHPGLVLEITGLEPPPPEATFEFGLLKDGYIWTFPKPDGYTICGGIFRGYQSKALHSSLINYATQEGIDLTHSHVTPHWLGLWNGDHPLHAQNALLVGEAANIADPLTAEGIRPSIWTGLKAAEAIHQSLNGDTNALATYTETIHQEWGADMMWAQRLATLIYSAPSLAYKGGIKRPQTSQLMPKILAGELRYGDIASEAIKQFSGSLIPGRGR